MISPKRPPLEDQLLKGLLRQGIVVQRLRCS